MRCSDLCWGEITLNAQVGGLQAAGADAGLPVQEAAVDFQLRNGGAPPSVCSFY